MALINCPECNKEISDKSIYCINCGYPIKIEEKDKLYKVTLLNATKNALTIKLITCLRNGSMLESNNIIENLPKEILYGINFNDVSTIKKYFQNVNATISIDIDTESLTENNIKLGIDKFNGIYNDNTKKHVNNSIHTIDKNTVK